MHAEGEDKRYYQNHRGKECCNLCPYNTITVGSVDAAVPDTIRKCVCKPGFFTQYVDFESIPKMKLWDPGEEKYTVSFPYPIPMSGYECRPCDSGPLVFTPEKKGMYCGEPTINGVIAVINDEDEGCTSATGNPVCVQNFGTLCRAYCPGGAQFPHAMPWFYLSSLFVEDGMVGLMNEEDFLGDNLYTTTTTTTIDPNSVT